MDLDKKVAIVTGGGSGMGRAISLEFARRGAQVVVADIQAPAAEEVAAEAGRSGAEAIALQTDVTRQDDVHRLVKDTLARRGRIDILVSNAGVRLVKPFLEHTLEDWNRMLAINLTAHFLAAQAVAPAMLEQGKGKIIINASIASFVGRPNRVAYCAAKAGAMGLVRAMAMDLRHRNVCVNALIPGSIATPLNAQAAGDPDVDWGRETLAGRWGTGEDIARAAAFLASDDADYITGAELKVDGGWLAARARDGEI
jgi:NAD(P)-dependent dehydrogenase (short-subunit alcohol dehydrogenase family)